MTKKSIKLYNIIFPIWLIFWFSPFFAPWLLVLVLLANFVIDSLIVLISSNLQGLKAKEIWKKSILKVWALGFLADFLGSALAFVTANLLSLSKALEPISSGIFYDWRENIWALPILIFIVIFTAAWIYIFNYNISFSELRKEGLLRKEDVRKLSLRLAIFTAPYLFLIPTSILY